MDGRIMFSLDSSYDFDNEELKYRFELSRDYTFTNTISVQEDLLVPQAFSDILAPGQYFYRVTVTNASGMTQTAMETYEGEDEIKRYGVRSFYVNPDGSIQVG